jgi:hypothetical protein
MQHKLTGEVGEVGLITLFIRRAKKNMEIDSAKIHQDCATLERLLLPYTILHRYRVKCLRLRPVEIPTDKRGCHLIEVTHLLDALWDAAQGLRCPEVNIPSIDPETHREISHQ